MLPTITRREWLAGVCALPLFGQTPATEPIELIAGPLTLVFEPEIAFVRYVEVSVNESDFIQSPNDWTRIAALGPADGLIKEVVQAFDVQSGSYQFECTLSRTRQG